QARKQFVAVGSQLGQGNTWLGEADVQSRLGQARPAESAAQRAAEFAAKGDATPNEFNAVMARARSLADQGRHSEANQQAYRALALLERWRTRGGSDASRTAMANWSEPYDFLIARLAQKPTGHSEALVLAEAAHAPVLLDLLARGARPAGSTDTRALQRQRQQAQKNRVEISRKLEQTHGLSARSRLVARLHDVDRELRIHELVDVAVLNQPLVRQKPVSPATRRALARAAGPILMYYAAADQTIAFLLLPGQREPRVQTLALSRRDLARDVRALRRELANPLWEMRAQTRARALFDQLLGPFANALAGYRHLTIIPHGPLHQLPFEALLDARGQPLFSRWHVSIAPSLSALHHLRKRETARRRRSGKSSQLVALAAGQGLHFPDHEVADIADIFPGNQTIFRQQNATFTAYRQAAPKARHLLLSTHGVHAPNNPTGSYLELTSSNAHDHRLTAGEIARIPLRAELVTLAACDTAKAEAMLSDERLDLTRAFLIAGASAVLATRWKVPESEQTRQFLIDFYRALRTGGPGGKGMRKDEALTHARRLSRDTHGANAQLWAAWVLIGDAR
ncbi:MAG: CHAT domain-containing protein, partial [Proteobacteria bacterium]|nr:CHAT domain-containing protein [Pseudomonadota bacterium]